MSRKKVKKKVYKDLELYPLSNQNTMTGQKGSGKTTLSVLYIVKYLSMKKTVFCNFRLTGGWYIAAARVMAGGPERFAALPVSRQADLVKDVRSRCFRFDEWDDLYKVKPRRGRGQSPEDQFLCVYDEGAIRLNSRAYQSRQARSTSRYNTPVRETQFFSQGRKLGFTLLVISQAEAALDNQFRQQAGYNIHLRHLANTGYMGIKLPVNRMLAIYRWPETKDRGAANKGTVMKRKLFPYPTWLGEYYDSWELFDSTTSYGLRYQYDPDYPLGRSHFSDWLDYRPAPDAPAASGDLHPADLARAEMAGLRLDLRRDEIPSVLPFEIGEQVSQERLNPWERVVVPPVEDPEKVA